MKLANKINHKYLVVTSRELTDVLMVSDLNSLSFKILCSAFSTITPNHDKFEKIHFSARHLATMFGMSKHNDFYYEIRKASEQIQFSNQLDVRVDKERKNQLVPLIKSCLYGDGMLSIEFSDEVASHLLNLKSNKSQIFSSYHIGDIDSLKKTRDIKFYWYALRRCFKTKSKFKLSIEEFILLLGLNSSYAEFSHLNRRVLKPLVRSLNETTHLNISFETLKFGRKVVGMVFEVIYIRENQGRVQSINESTKVRPQIELAIAVLQQNLGIKEVSARYLVEKNLIEELGIDESLLVCHIRSRIDQVNNNIDFPNTEVKNLSIVSAIKENVKIVA